MKTITFYSYKGGVGRSLALANMAKRLSEFNKKICLLDFDLEAPGLAHKFSSNINPKTIKKGIVDYVHEYYVNGNLPASIKDFSSQFHIYKDKEPVNFIAAGNTNSNDYWRKLSAINWYELLYENENGLSFFLDLKEKIKLEFNPDFLLIDSRTGITETSGITTSILADEVVVLAANNRENLEGSQKIINSLGNNINAILEKAPKMIFVLSRIPFTEKPEDKAKEINLIRRVKSYFDHSIIDEINVIHSDRDLEENEQLKIGYDKDDNNSAQISRDYLKLFEKITKNDLTEEEVKKFKKIKLSENFYAKSLSEEIIDKKIEYISEAIALNPENIDFYSHRANLYTLVKKYTEAIEDCNSIIEMKPDYDGAYLTLGVAYFEMGKYEMAIDVNNKALEFAPRNELIYENLGIFYSLLKDQSKAIDFFHKAININPFLSTSYNGCANSYRILGDNKKALENVYKSIELNSASPIAYSTLAEINAQLGNENEFFINIETALRLLSQEKGTASFLYSLRSIEEGIKTDQIYQQFYKNDRFVGILEKYNIVLLNNEIIS